VILVDTGPLVALFEPKDDAHESMVACLAGIGGRLLTTLPVLTEAFHLLEPGSRGAAALSDFIDGRGLDVWFLDAAELRRALELMRRYADHPMDLADASLVAAAERHRTTKILTLDRGDFTTYRARIGRTYRAFHLVVAPEP
jgi:uncharacterized protein